MSGEAERILTLPIEEWRRLTRDGGLLPVRITLNGDSMRPLIRRNRDYVTILPCTRPVQRGEIVLFADDRGRYVVHRVWKRQGGRIRTLGDNCLHPDPWLMPDQIWGIVTKIERGGRSCSADSLPLRIFGSIWLAAYPLRRSCRLLRRLAGSILRRLKKHV